MEAQNSSSVAEQSQASTSPAGEAPQAEVAAQSQTEAKATETAQQSASETTADEFDLFGEAVSEAELRGEVVEEEKTKQSDAPEDHGEEQTADPEPKGESEEQQGNKPPKGFVPHAALAEERSKRKEAQQRLEALEQQLQNARQQQQLAEQQQENTPEPEDISDEVRRFAQENPQFRALVFENSRDGKILRDKIESFGEDDAYVFARTIAADRNIAAQKQASFEQGNAAYFQRCVQEMSTMFEGGLDGEEATNLISYLQNDAGLSADTVTVLTSPNTIIIDPRTGRQSYMGRRALELVGAFKESFTLARTADPKRIRAEVEAELEPRITKQVLSKVNGGNEFVDIGNAPGHGEALQSKLPQTEEEFAKLSPEQQERLLRGDFS